MKKFLVTLALGLVLVFASGIAMAEDAPAAPAAAAAAAGNRGGSSAAAGSPSVSQGLPGQDIHQLLSALQALMRGGGNAGAHVPPPPPPPAAPGGT